MSSLQKMTVYLQNKERCSHIPVVLDVRLLRENEALDGLGKGT